MIYIKKIGALLLFVIITLLCGCVSDPTTYYFDANNITTQATKIQLVLCENKNPININVEEDTILFFDIDNIRIIETLETKKIDEFAYELSTITFHKERKSVNSPIGYTIMIYMQNQELIVLSCTVISGVAYGMAAVFLNDGSFVRHIARFADEPKFKRLLHNYFDFDESQILESA